MRYPGVMADERPKLGRILIKRKLVSVETLERALADQRTSARPLASQLTEAGSVKEVDALRALSEQFGVPGVDLPQLYLATAHLDILPREIAVARKILPVLVKDDRLFLAMADPHDRRAIDELEFVSGRRVFPYVAISTGLDRTIADAYDAKDKGRSHYFGAAVPQSKRAELSGPESVGRGREDTSFLPLPAAGQESGVVVDVDAESSARSATLSVADFGAGDVEDDAKTTQPKLSSPASALPPAPPHGPAPATVLVVDDDEDIRKLVVKLMVAKGHRVVEAGRGLLALSLVQGDTPDLIILDGMLPEVHGFDIVRRLKGSQKYGHIPIVLMSAVHRGWRIAADMRANYGIEEFVEKPFRIADLDLAVARALKDKSGEPPRDHAINREAQALLEQGIRAFKRGDIKGAIDLLRRGVQVDPFAYRLRYQLGLLFGRDGQVYEAVSELERAVELNPSAFQSLKNLAVLYEQAGFKNKATDMWERCLDSATDEATRGVVKKRILALLPG